MKTAALPSVRVEPELRAEVDALLGDGESLSKFVEQSVRAAVRRRKVQAEFVARGLASLEEAKRTGIWIEADTVVEQLEQRLADAIKRQAAARE